MTIKSNDQIFAAICSLGEVLHITARMNTVDKHIVYYIPSKSRCLELVTLLQDASKPDTTITTTVMWGQHIVVVRQ